jgi:hypothetical protein
MADYEALKTEIATDPLSRGYAGMTDDALAGSLSAVDRDGPTIDVPIAAIEEFLLINGLLAGLEALAEARPVTASSAAARSLIGLVRSTRLTEVTMSIPEKASQIENMLAALIAAGALTQAQGDALLALAAPKISRAQEIGFGPVVMAADIDHARRL